MNITVSQYIKQKNRLFEGARIASIKLKEVEAVVIHSDPSFFGNAFHIALEYAFYQKGYSNTFEPNITRVCHNNGLLEDVMGKIKRKQPLSIENLVLLTKGEQYYRSAYSTMEITDKEMEAMKKDEVLINERVHWILDKQEAWGTLVVAPTFDLNSVGLRGDGDFIEKGVLYEVKCVKDSKISSRTQKQLMLYYLLNEERKHLGQESYEIKQFGYINPLRKEWVIWDIEIPSEVKNNWKARKI